MYRTHGLRCAPEYRVWATMIQRCHNPKVKSYKEYGAAGVRVCDEWRRSAKAFLDHIGPRPTPKHTIDRINNALGYGPGNVRWATRQEQSLNRSGVVLVTLDGITDSVQGWSRRTGIEDSTIRRRIRKGLTPEAAIRMGKRARFDGFGYAAARRLLTVEKRRAELLGEVA